MSYFAKVLSGTVVSVIKAGQDFMDSFVDSSPGVWIQTSFNTKGGVHYSPSTGAPDGGVALRGNYAEIGGSYDSVNDVFISKKPFESWVLNSSYLWEAPIAYPSDGFLYEWDEATVSWLKQ